MIRQPTGKAQERPNFRLVKPYFVMTIAEHVVALDQLIVAGQMQEAFAEFFHDNAVTQANRAERTATKAEKQQRLAEFFAHGTRTDAIRLHSYAVTGNVSFSEFTMRFTLPSGQTKEWIEVIRRWWRDGLVVDEKYYFGAETDEPNVTQVSQTEPADEQTDDIFLLGMAEEDTLAGEAEESLGPDTTFDVIVAPDGTLTEIADTVDSVGDVETETIEILNKSDGTDIELITIQELSGMPNVDQVDKLVLIEGIGPKTAKLLTEAGIRTFSQLAETPIDRIREILTGAGSRFRIQDATAWTERARTLAEA